MPKRYIILQPIGNNKGSGVVTLTDNKVTVSVSGTNEEFNLYFMSSNPSVTETKINAGTIKGGFAKSFELKAEDVKKIDTVVLLRGKEPFIYGSLAPVILPEFNGVEKEKDVHNKGKFSLLGENDSFSWLKIEDGRFAENCPIIRYIFENINVICKINSVGYYYYGTMGVKSAVAILADENEKNPFTHLSDCARYIKGYWTVGIDKREKYFYSLVD